MRQVKLGAGVLSAVLLGAAGLTGCSNFRDLFSAHADVAAEASGMELPAERLAQILAGARGQQRITREAAEFVANTWVDYALFAQSVAQGKLPTDSAGVAEVLWPEISELKGTHFHDTLMARRADMANDAAADSVYQGSDVRVLQHILFAVRPNTAADAKGTTKKKAEGTLTRLRGGADFESLAARLSEDPGSKADSGYLPPSPKGRYVPAFDSVGWALGPGQMSGLVETPFGFHIIRRPSMQEARGRLTGYLKERAGVRLDSLYMDSLATQNQIEVQKDAPAAMRDAADNPDEARKSDKALVKFKGGALTVKEYMRWVRALPPQYGPQIKQANDSTLSQFAKVLSQNVLLLREADKAGIKITPAEWGDLRSRYVASLDTLRKEMDLAGPDVTDSSATADERRQIASDKVQQYFDGLVSGKVRLRPLPSALATLLRERMSYRVYPAGINSAVESAQSMRASKDSAEAGAKLERAPGPAPVPVPGAAAPGDSGRAAPAPVPAPAPAPDTVSRR